jgi:hypothetical protein
VYNLGASLQAYALQYYLEKQGHDVRIIDYKPNYLSRHYSLTSVNNPKYDKPIIKQLYLLAKFPGRLKSLSRKRVFDRFTSKYLHLTERYDSYEALAVKPPYADIYIAGSDQIWNTLFMNGRDAAFYLAFGNVSAKRISYAASFATDEIASAYKDFVKEQLKKFDAISVREESGLRILSDWNFNGCLAVDPVFLLDKTEWRDIESTDGVGADYILVYDFYSDKAIQCVSESLARLYGCMIYSIGPTFLKYADRNFVDYGPQSFVGLVRNARCVVSNSYHGSVFSIIFKRDFFVLNREDGLNSRMYNLLRHYQLEDRLINVDVSEKTLLSRIDYTNVNRILSVDIARSKSFLETQIN